METLQVPVCLWLLLDLFAEEVKKEEVFGKGLWGRRPSLSASSLLVFVS